MQQDQGSGDRADERQIDEKESEGIPPVTGIAIAVWIFLGVGALLALVAHFYVNEHSASVKFFVDAMFSVALTIVVVIQAVIYRNQWRVMGLQLREANKQAIAMQRQIDLIKQQAVRSQQEFLISRRPWVAMVGHPQIVSPLTFDARGEAHIEVSCVLRNGGGSPAIGTIMNGRLVMLKKRVHDQAGTFRVPECDSKLLFLMREPDAGVLIIPQIDTEYPVKTYYGLVTDNQVTEVCLSGCIAYVDEFGNPHATEFVERFETASGERLLRPDGIVQGGHFETLGFGRAY